jgi:hypothetical protein
MADLPILDFSHSNPDLSEVDGNINQGEQHRRDQPVEEIIQPGKRNDGDDEKGEAEVRDYQRLQIQIPFPSGALEGDDRAKGACH